MGMGDKTVRELFVGNTPQGTSDFVLLEFLNAAMKQVGVRVDSCWVTFRLEFYSGKKDFPPVAVAVSCTREVPFLLIREWSAFFLLGHSRGYPRLYF